MSVGLACFTLAFDSSSIKGEGVLCRLVCLVVSQATPLWIADQVRNDVTMCCIVFTLTFDSSPIKGEGILSVDAVLFILALVLFHQGRGVYDWRCLVFNRVTLPPSGYCIKASVTVHGWFSSVLAGCL